MPLVSQLSFTAWERTSESEDQQRPSWRLAPTTYMGVSCVVRVIAQLIETPRPGQVLALCGWVSWGKEYNLSYHQPPRLSTIVPVHKAAVRLYETGYTKCLTQCLRVQKLACDSNYQLYYFEYFHSIIFPDLHFYLHPLIIFWGLTCIP